VGGTLLAGWVGLGACDEQPSRNIYRRLGVDWQATDAENIGRAEDKLLQQHMYIYLYIY
jgi:hypothetical protein